MKLLFLGAGAAGINLYRLWNYADWAVDVGHKVTKAEQDDDWFESACESPPDVLLTNLSTSLDRLSKLAYLRTLGVKLIIDYDDANSYVPDYNQAKSFTHNNTLTFKVWEAHYKEADAITTTTAKLAELEHPEAYVVPNFVHEDWFDTLKRQHDDIRIAFSGAVAGRHEDMEFLRPLMTEILTNDERVKFINFGVCYDWMLELPRTYTIAWADPHTYFKALNHLNIDIGLAPLATNEFNRGKSGIKYYEYAMVGAAGIYSALEPYEDVVDGVTGLVVEPDEHCWLDAIDRLIGSVDTRRQISHNAYVDVCESHTSSDALARVLREVTDDRNSEFVPTEASDSAGTHQRSSA